MQKNINLDIPLCFSAGYCHLCRHKDKNWVALQFLNDGVWRKLKPDQSLRQQGLDEKNMDSIYYIHHCAEQIILSFSSPQELTLFMMRLYEHP